MSIILVTTDTLSLKTHYTLLGVMQSVSQSVNLKATWLSLQGISNLSSYIGFLAIPNFEIEEKKRVA